MLKHRNFMESLNYAYTRNEKFLPEDWDVLIDSKDYSKPASSFDAVALINHKNKEIVVAYPGISIDTKDLSSVPNGVCAWYEIYKGVIPTNFGASTAFLAALSKEISADKNKGYKVVNIGHAIGAVNSDLSTLYLHKNGLKSISITYENPGSTPILQKYSLENNIKLDHLNNHFASINSQDSIVNELHPHFGNVTRVIIPQGSNHTLLSTASFTLAQIAGVIQLASKAYEFYFTVLNPNANVTSSTYNNTAASFVTSALADSLSKGITAVAGALAEIDFAIFTQKFDTIRHYIEDERRMDGAEFNINENEMLLDWNTANTALHTL